MWLENRPEVKVHSTLVVAGDSRLITDFLARRAKPSNPVLVALVREAREAARKLGMRVHFVHVPRERNAWADYLANQSFMWQRSVDLWELAETVPLGDSAPREIAPRPAEADPSIKSDGLCGAVWTESEPEPPKC